MRYIKIDSLPSSKKKWIDKDVEMYHACFQLLVNAVEKEKVHTHVCQEVHKEFVEEVVYLYLWWKKVTKYDKVFYCDSKEADQHLLRLLKIRKKLWT